jgi:hypothetical protein
VAPLFVRYADAVGDQATQRLTLRVTIDGALWLTEELVLRPDRAAQPVVELLSRDPESLAHLRRLASGPTNDVRFELLAPDGTARRATLEELDAESARLTSAVLRPQRVTSVVRLAAQVSGPTRIPCDDCYVNYDNCIAGCDGLPSCEARCDRILTRCLSTCSGGGCTPTSQTVVEQQVTGTTYLGFDCFTTYFDPAAKYRDVWQFNIKYTRKRITYNCDGTQTVEILEVWYATQICITASGWGSCSFPTSWPGCLV